MVSFSKNCSFWKVAAIASILLAFSLSCTNASFVLPKAFTTTLCARDGAIALPSDSSGHRHSITPLNAIPIVDGTIHVALSPTIVATSTILLREEINSSLELLKSVLIAIGAVVVGFAALTFVTINFVVPKAAEQLEADTKRLKPELWEEYQAKLEEGETMSTRPDLLQELGTIMKPFVMSSYEASAMGKRSNDAGDEE